MQRPIQTTISSVAILALAILALAILDTRSCLGLRRLPCASSGPAPAPAPEHWRCRRVGRLGPWPIADLRLPHSRGTNSGGSGRPFDPGDPCGALTSRPIAPLRHDGRRR